MKLVMKIFYEWDDDSFDWILDEKGFYYRSQLVGATEIFADRFTVFPNPVSNHLTIKNNGFEPTKVILFSTPGKIISEVTFTGSSATINMQELPNGFYFLQIVNDKSAITKKIIKN